MLNNQNKNNVTFEGTGTLVIKYQKYTNKIGQDITGFIKTQTGKAVSNIKEVLIQNGALNKAGDMLNLPPRHVEILEGAEHFDEALIQNSKFIIQKGGVLEKKIKGEHIVFKNGTNVGAEGDIVVLRDAQNSGDIKATDIVIIQNTAITSPKIEAIETYITNSGNMNSINIKGSVDLKGNSVLRRADISGNAYLDDQALLADSNIGEMAVTNGNSVIKRSIIKGDAQAHGKSEILNSSMERDLLADGNSRIVDVSIGEDLKASNNAEVSKAIVFNDAKIQGDADFKDSTVHGDLSGYSNAKMKNIEVGESASLFGDASLDKAKIGTNLNLGYSAKASNAKVSNSINVYGDSYNVHLKNIKGAHLGIFGKATLAGNIEGQFKSLSKAASFEPTVKLNETARKSLPVRNLETFKIKYGKANRMSV